MNSRCESEIERGRPQWMGYEISRHPWLSLPCVTSPSLPHSAPRSVLFSVCLCFSLSLSFSFSSLCPFCCISLHHSPYSSPFLRPFFLCPFTCRSLFLRVPLCLLCFLSIPLVVSRPSVSRSAPSPVCLCFSVVSTSDPSSVPSSVCHSSLLFSVSASLVQFLCRPIPTPFSPKRIIER